MCESKDKGGLCFGTNSRVKKLFKSGISLCDNVGSNEVTFLTRKHHASVQGEVRKSHFQSFGMKLLKCSACITLKADAYLEI